MTYIIFDNNTKLYKIGKSKNVTKRLSTLKTGNLNLELVLTLNYLSEKELHKIFINKKVEREWFELTSEDLEAIIDLEIYGIS